MKLPAGTLLGCYEVLAPLGAGDISEVYRARDERLKVAIKIPREEFFEDKERVARFEREVLLDRFRARGGDVWILEGAG